jgi:hypothetical protein
VIDFRNKLRRSLSGIMFVFTAVALAGAFLMYVYFSLRLNPRMFVSDVHEHAFLPLYAGSFSNLGVIVLWTSAVVSAVAALFGTFAHLARRRFVVSVAAVNGLLALDDFFMGHEYAGLLLARALGSTNEGEDRQVMEVFVFAVFIVLGVAWVWWARDHIWDSLYPLLLLGVAGYALSVALDLGTSAYPDFDRFNVRVVTVTAVVEDLLKLVGIGGFALYGWKTATPYLKAAPLHQASSPIS